MCLASHTVKPKASRKRNAMNRKGYFTKLYEQYQRLQMNIKDFKLWQWNYLNQAVTPDNSNFQRSQKNVQVIGSSWKLTRVKFYRNWPKEKQNSLRVNGKVQLLGVDCIQVAYLSQQFWAMLSKNLKKTILRLNHVYYM